MFGDQQTIPILLFNKLFNLKVTVQCRDHCLPLVFSLGAKNSLKQMPFFYLPEVLEAQHKKN
jgi:hypothetical protein